MNKRIGILTGGGDCPGLNAVLRAVGKTLIPRGWEVVGFEDGYLGVLEEKYRVLDNMALSGILTDGGTILGSSNRDNPFQWRPWSVDPHSVPATDCSARVKNCVEKLKLDGIITIGGDGTISIADRLHRECGVPCIGVPKTIDNDLSATDVTFGFDTAVEIATQCIDRLHSTAMSHHRVQVVELMGRYAGWLTLFAGTASGSDVILLPEIPYVEKVVFERLLYRSRSGKRFSIVAVAEGAKPLGGTLHVQEHDVKRTDPIRLGGIAHHLAKRIEDGTGLEARATVLGHLQRGGTPTARDRILATEFGNLAAQLVLQGKWGLMSAVRNGVFSAVPLTDAIGQLKVVSLDNSLIRAARDIGTSFGDEPV